MKLLPLCFLVLLSLTLCAQRSELGVSLNAWNYQGDIVPNNAPYLEETRPGVGLFYRNTFHNNFAFRADAAIGQIRGSDLNFEERAAFNPRLDFKTNLFTLSGMLEWNILGRERRNIRVYDASGQRIPYTDLRADGSVPYYDQEGYLIERKLRLKRTISPYLTIGAGALFHDPTLTVNSPDGRTVTQKELDEDYGKVNLITPVGAGVKFYLNDRWTLHADVLMLPTYNDYIDGASDSRNPEDNDWLSRGSLGLSYLLGPRDKDGDGVVDKEDRCPDVPGTVATAGCPDADGDGIADQDDLCPDQAGPASTRGCPDRDGDSIPDKDDACPDQAGSLAMQGCPDQDGDNIPDKDDACPSEAGPRELQGCPDRDGDGIADRDDACPDQAGDLKLKGCPDTDGDGLADKDDRCPTETGPASTRGCPDRDGDGVADLEDKCPDVAGPTANSGCPELTAEDKETVAYAIQNIQFQTGSTRVRSASLKILDEIVDIMQRYPAYHLRIEGHTDSDGRAESNQRLSEGRAKACHDYLVSKGIASSRLSHAGFGATRPIAPNDTPANKQLNRRTNFEFHIP